MSVSSISSSDSSLSAIRDRFQAFRSGKSNITKDELKAIKDEFGSKNPASKLYDNYDKVDLNGDGVSFEELQTYAKTNKSSFQGPPSLTKDQLTEMRDKISSSDSERAGDLDKLIQNFSSADSDGDGSIGGDEFKTYAEANGFAAPPDGPPPGAGPRGRGGPKDMTKDDLTAMRDKIASTDTTAASNLDKLIQNFDSTDTDGDGKISKDEFKAFAEANGISMPHPPHHSKGTSSMGAETANSESDEDDSESKNKTDSTSSLSALIQSILQRYSQVDTDYTSLLSDVKA